MGYIMLGKMTRLIKYQNPRDGKYILQIRETEQERSFIVLGIFPPRSLQIILAAA
jgi:hypothetical protein